MWLTRPIPSLSWLLLLSLLVSAWIANWINNKISLSVENYLWKIVRNVGFGAGVEQDNRHHYSQINFSFFFLFHRNIFGIDFNSSTIILIILDFPYHTIEKIFLPPFLRDEGVVFEFRPVILFQPGCSGLPRDILFDFRFQNFSTITRLLQNSVFSSKIWQKSMWFLSFYSRAKFSS